MALKKKHPKQDLQPPLDVELVWRAHILHPQKYMQDMSTYFSRTEDLPEIIRVQAGNIEHLMTVTSKLWGQEFNSSIEVPGVKNRTLQESYKLHKFNSQHLSQTEQVHEITLDDICISDVWSRDRNLVLMARRLAYSSFSYQNVFRLKGKLDQAISTKDHPSKGKVHFDAKQHRGIELHIYGVAGKCCMKKERHIATTLLDPRDVFQKDNVKERSFPVEIPRVLSIDPRITFNCTIQTIQKKKSQIFCLNREQFSKESIPKDLKPFIEYLPSWKEVNLKTRDAFSVAKHRSVLFILYTI